MLQVTRGTQALLDLEDDAPEVLFERVPGSPVPLWPSVRIEFSAVLTELDLDYPMQAGPATGFNPLALLATAFAPSRWDVRSMPTDRDLLYLVGGGTTYGVATGQRNWLVGDFADAFPRRSAILQWRPLPHPAGPPAFHPTRTLDRLVTRAAAYGRLRPVTPEAEVVIRRLVGEFARRLDDRLDEALIESIAGAALYAERLRPAIDRGFAGMLDRVRPRIVLMEDASYGRWGSLIAMMKQRGILVAEPQHGWLGPSHAAYNFGAAMASPGLKATLPDELLSFGEYWAHGLRFPGSITPIGKPHLEAQAAAARVASAPDREVLWVSSTTAPDQVSDLVLALSAALGPGWTVRFRPHPVERATLAAVYPKLMGAAGVVMDERGDVAESLAAARAVVGVASTVLFEALAFGVPVFAIESPSAPFYIGDLFGPLISSPAGLRRVVDAIAGDATHDPRPPALATPVDQIWRPGALENFRDWTVQRRR